VLEVLHTIKFIMLHFLKSVLCLKYSTKLFCSWYKCCVQTSTFFSCFKWSKFWNQISCVLCSFLARTQNAGYLIPELPSFEEILKRRSSDATVILTAK